MVKWEYFWLFALNSRSGAANNEFNLGTQQGVNLLEEELTRLGNEGWELVTVMPIAGVLYEEERYPRTMNTMWVFKRQSEQSSEYDTNRVNLEDWDIPDESLPN